MRNTHSESYVVVGLASSQSMLKVRSARRVRARRLRTVRQQATRTDPRCEGLRLALLDADAFDRDTLPGAVPGVGGQAADRLHHVVAVHHPAEDRVPVVQVTGRADRDEELRA